MSRFHQTLKPEAILKLANVPHSGNDRETGVQLARLAEWCSNNLVLVLEDCPLCGQSREDCEADPCPESSECCDDCGSDPCTC